MTAYLSANLRHTDKRLQQSGPAVVALRHHAGARSGARLMFMHEGGGAMTSSAPCWDFYFLFVPILAFFRLRIQSNHHKHTDNAVLTVCD